MKTKKIGLVVVLLIIILLMVYCEKGAVRRVAYDCRISEISPDYPVEVKEACRKQRMEKIK